MPTIRVAHNFAENLELIRQFLAEQDADAAFDALVEQLFERVIPSLESFPAIGVSFLARQPASMEGRARLAALARRLPADVDIREYISGDYLVLYAVRGEEIFLLSIKHHRQLSYDLTRYYP